MTNADLSRIVDELRKHVDQTRREQGDEEQAVHNFMARHGLTPTEHYGVLDEYRRRAASHDRPADPAP